MLRLPTPSMSIRHTFQQFTVKQNTNLHRHWTSIECKDSIGYARPNERYAAKTSTMNQSKRCLWYISLGAKPPNLKTINISSWLYSILLVSKVSSDTGINGLPVHVARVGTLLCYVQVLWLLVRIHAVEKWPETRSAGRRHMQWSVRQEHYKWRKGHLFPTWARKTTRRCFDWLLQLSSGQKWRSEQMLIFTAMHYTSSYFPSSSW